MMKSERPWGEVMSRREYYGGHILPISFCCGGRYIIDNSTGEIVRPWNIAGIIRMMRFSARWYKRYVRGEVEFYC